MLKNLIICLAIKCIFLTSSFTQITERGIPLSFTEKTLKSISFIELEVSELPEGKPELNEELNSPGYKKLEFAKSFKVNKNPYNSGKWELTKSGKIWRLGFVSSGAINLNVLFNPIQIPAKARLFIYDPLGNNILGAITSENNNKSKLLNTQPIPGEKIIIELNLPPEFNETVELNIQSVFHDFKGVYQLMGKSGDCNIDINCEQGKEWEETKNAIFSFIFAKLNGQQELCTGTLINNTKQDKTPYFLTAQHCIMDSLAATSVVAIFNYESAYCDGPNLPMNKSLSGAKLISTAPRIDFSLCEFNEIPPYLYHPYYAGWYSNERAFNFVTCIHHPNGDGKKLAYYNGFILSSQYSNEYLQDNHWLISEWTAGTTEPGSSGAPLLNKEKQIIGCLTGGFATCEDPVKDFFAKFSNAWDYYSEPESQVKTWLDPIQTGVYELGGFDPYEEYLQNCDTLKSILYTSSLSALALDTGWGYWSGNNALGISNYAEQFFANSRIDIAGVYINIAKSNVSSEDPAIKIKLWTDYEGYPDIVMAEKKYLLSYLIEDSLNYFEFDNIITVQGTFYIGYELSNQVESDTFAVFQSSKQNEGYYIKLTDTWLKIHKFSEDQINGNLDIRVVACDSIPAFLEIKDTNYNSRIKVYPNPSNNHFYIDLTKQSNKNINITLYNFLGQSFIMDKTAVSGNLYQINTNHIPAGIYLLRINFPDKIVTQNLLIVK
ncbi:T9SS type A sorting domain-containing protein [Bacteroidota bacterium]